MRLVDDVIDSCGVQRAWPSLWMNR